MKKWKKQYFVVWGETPPPGAQKWMADLLEMLDPVSVPTDAGVRAEILEEFELFVKDNRGLSHEQYYNANFAEALGDDPYLWTDLSDDDEDDAIKNLTALDEAALEAYIAYSEQSGMPVRQVLELSPEELKTLHEETQTVSEKKTQKEGKTLIYKGEGKDDYGDYSEYEHPDTKVPYFYYKNGGIRFIDYKDGTPFSSWLKLCPKDAKVGGTKASPKKSSTKSYSEGTYWGTYYSSGNTEKDKMRKLAYRPAPYEFPVWDWKRTIVVGDIHGCADELLDLLDLVGFRPGEDRLISLGDVVDRGPKVHECFEILRAYNAWMCLGNHEEPFLKWWMFETHPDYKDKWSGKNNPIDLTYRDDQEATLKQLTEEDWRTMYRMQLFFRLREYKHNPLCVHAGLYPGAIRPEDMDPFGIIRMVSLDSSDKTLPFGATYGTEWWDKYELNPGRYHVLYGHSTSKEVRAMHHSTGLDTGVCYGGSLSALVLPDWKFASVQSKEQHYYGSKAEISGNQNFQIGKTKEDLEKEKAKKSETKSQKIVTISQDSPTDLLDTKKNRVFN